MYSLKIEENKKDLENFLISQGIIFPSSKSIDQLWNFHTLFTEANHDRDLSRITNFSEIAEKHYLDCALVCKLTELPSPLLDIGTGAGFPGIIIKIFKPGIEIILAEGRKKRAAFLEHIIGKLDLKGISVFPHRVGPTFSIPVNGIITRALEPLPQSLHRASFFLPKNGKLFFMKGPGADPEIKEAKKKFKEEYLLHKKIDYTLAQDKNKRILVIWRRIREIIPGKEKPTAERKKIPFQTESRQITEITSPANPFYKSSVKILQSRGIKKESKFFLFGEKIIRESLRIFSEKTEKHSKILAWVCADSMADRLPEFNTEIPIFLLKQKLYNNLDIMNSGYPLLLMEKNELPAWTGDISKNSMDLFLPFQDPGNIGTAIRSAVAFDVKRVILLKESANPFQPKAIRASGSSLFQIPVMEGPSLRDLLLDHKNYSRDCSKLAILDKEGKPIEEILYQKEIGLIPGIEGPGFDFNKADLEFINNTYASYGIKINDKLESINAASALSIALFMFNSRKKNPPKSPFTKGGRGDFHCL